MRYKCLSIAGFDGSGGAGLQADLKTFSALGCYGMSVLTVLPVQNTCGVKSLWDIPLSAIEEQLITLFEDTTPDSIKIGMLFSKPIINLVTSFLRTNAHNIPIVLDPVMVAKSGDRLLEEDAVAALKTELVPLATIVTPNLPEAQALIPTHYDKQSLAQKIRDLGAQAVLLKGGHDDTHSQTVDDLFLSAHHKAILSAPRIATQNTHGTGCTLSAAIASFLAQKYSLFESCKRAKHYLSGALFAAKDIQIGKGHGPVHHFYQHFPL